MCYPPYNNRFNLNARGCHASRLRGPLRQFPQALLLRRRAFGRALRLIERYTDKEKYEIKKTWYDSDFLNVNSFRCARKWEKYV